MFSGYPNVLVVLVLCCLISLYRMVERPSRCYRFPYFMSVVFLAFICPQAFAACSGVWRQDAVERMGMMALLCLVGCWVGYALSPRRTAWKMLNTQFCIQRFFAGGIVLLVIGLYAQYKFNMSQADGGTGGLLTGIATIYLFFAGMVFPGFAICLYYLLLTKKPIGYVAVGIASGVPLYEAFVYARREHTALFILTIALAFYFLRGYVPSRPVVLGAIVVGALAVPTAAMYRQNSKEDGVVSALRRIDMVNEYERYHTAEAAHEVNNAIALIEATTKTGAYRLGSGYWNQLVFRFVPAQLVGIGIKNDLMIDAAGLDVGEFISDSTGYVVWPGTTVTGVGDAFREFGYFGALVFCVMGWLFQNLWVAANSAGGIMSQLIYIQVMTSAMRAVTHQTVDFLPGFIYGSVGIWLVFAFARRAGRDLRRI